MHLDPHLQSCLQPSVRVPECGPPVTCPPVSPEPYTCGACGIQFQFYSNLLEHMQSHAGKAQRAPKHTSGSNKQNPPRSHTPPHPTHNQTHTSLPLSGNLPSEPQPAHPSSLASLNSGISALSQGGFRRREEDGLPRGCRPEKETCHWVQGEHELMVERPAVR